jgi:hypothetical protein
LATVFSPRRGSFEWEAEELGQLGTAEFTNIEEPECRFGRGRILLRSSSNVVPIDFAIEHHDLIDELAFPQSFGKHAQR